MDGKMSDGYIVKETGWRVRERERERESKPEQGYKGKERKNLKFYNMLIK